jgi:hypothetical protein
MKRVIIIFVSILLCNCSFFQEGKEHIVIGYSECWGNFAFGVINNGKIKFYEWDSNLNQWENKQGYDFNIPFGYKDVFSFGSTQLGIESALLGVEFKKEIRFFKYVNGKWRKLYLRKNRSDEGEIIGNYDLSLPKDSVRIFSPYREIWIKKNSEITVLHYSENREYDEDKSGYIYNPKWEPYIYNGLLSEDTKIFYDLTVFNNYDSFVHWFDFGVVGAIQNLKLEFFRIENSENQAYFRTYNSIPNSNFILPEEYESVFGAGKNSIGVVVDNKIKIYSTVIDHDGYGHVINWNNWKYLDYMDFDLNKK